MRWKRVLKKLKPDQLTDIFVSIVLEILNAWALIRTVIVLALVLTVILSSAIANVDMGQFKGLLDEKISMVIRMFIPSK
jgi:hypothetical protein